MDGTINTVQEEMKSDFLLEVMGDKYEEFVKNGKIEIKSGENTYELKKDGSVINKHSGQQISIVPKIAGLPFSEILAIKYSWIKYGFLTGNHIQLIITDNGRLIKDRLTYIDLIRYMENKGWRMNPTIIKENSSIIGSYENGIKIECSPPMLLTIKGYEQDPHRNGYRLWLKFYDNNKGLEEKDVIQIIKLFSDNSYNILWKGFYEQLSVSITQNISINIGCPGGRTISVAGIPQYFMWKNGIVLNDKESIIIKPENKNIEINKNNIKLYMEADFWTKNSKESFNKC